MKGDQAVKNIVEHSVFVIGGHDDEQISLLRSEADEVCLLVCVVGDETHSIYAPDFFEALCLLRMHVLEPKGLIPFCYGASLNVWPSDVLRDAERGLKAYKIAMDTQAFDLVDIFDSDYDVIPASLAEQEDYTRDWIASSHR